MSRLNKWKMRGVAVVFATLAGLAFTAPASASVELLGLSTGDITGSTVNTGDISTGEITLL
ncbi:MAG: hypothetical protein ACRDT8_12155 [Micromonosporaceae bacterium]